MSEGVGGVQDAAALAAADLLELAVERLLAEAPVELPGPVALERLRTVLACTERLKAAALTAIRDLDSRELYALDAAGSARTWLRRQPGGEDGQVTLARRLANRPTVATALAQARIGLRSATQLCTALEHVPDDLDDTLVTAVVQDGIGRLLLEQTGGTPEDDTAAAAVLTQRAADQQVLAACVAEVTATPAARVEPAMVLLAERLAPAQLSSALRLLLDPLQPDGTDLPDADPYYLELRILADGDVDLRGLLDPETGHNLATEIERRLDAARTAAANARRTTEPPSAVDVDIAREAGVADEPLPLFGHADTDPADAADLEDAADVEDAADPVDPADAGDDPTDAADPVDVDEDPLAAWDRALADAHAAAARRAAQPDGDRGVADRGPDAPRRLLSIGRRRHDALRDLLTDTAASTTDGQPAPAHLTVLATLDAVAGHPGALPAQLLLPNGRSTALPPETLQRLGCHSHLDAVLLDAAGNPVGASTTRRMPNRRERRALHARWGPTCATAGCHHTRTVPHHVIPWWLSHRTQLSDLVPLCTSCHHDLHEGHRTLQLRDGRLITTTGWAEALPAAA